jgi:hypothetical protein
MAGQRPGLLPTSSPSLMTTMRRGVARWLAGSRQAPLSAAGAGRPMTTTRLPIWVGFMAAPVVRWPTSVYAEELGWPCDLSRDRCYGKGVEDGRGLRSDRRQPQYPLGTVALYGPDDKATTKIAAGVILHDGAEPILNR